MIRLAFLSVLAVILMSGSAFAACVVETGFRSVDNPTPPDAEWADTESLSPTTGGEEEYLYTVDTETREQGCTPS